MKKNHCLEAIKRRAGGRFVDVDDVLLALFNDPECRDRRRWPEVFGQRSVAPPRDRAGVFIARALRERIEKMPTDD